MKDSFDGVKFNRLIVLHEIELRQNPCGKRKRMVIARCDCGTERAYQLGNLKSGNTYSCGCYDAEVLAARNADARVPQAWVIEDDLAWTEIEGIRILVDVEDVQIVGLFCWHVAKEYPQCEELRKTMGRLLLGLPNGDRREAEHRNHNGMDNRRSVNLRVATSQQNKWNIRKRCGLTSQFKGVSWDKERGRWKMQIKLPDGKRVIRRFFLEIDAAISYDEMAEPHFGEFAVLNSIPNRGDGHAGTPD